MRRNLMAMILALGVAILLCLLELSQSSSLYRGGPLYALEMAAQDTVLRGRDPLWYQQRPKAEIETTVQIDPRNIITIVAMDDRSIAELGHWFSWPWTYYGDVLDKIAAQSPRTVAFDVGYFEPKVGDSDFAAAIQRAKTRVPPVSVIIPAVGGGDPAPGPNYTLQFREGLQPLPELMQFADVGSANAFPDGTGTVRYMPTFVRLGDVERPTLGVAAVAKYFRRPNFNVERPDPGTMLIAGRRVPVNDMGLVRVNYYGPPSSVGDPASTYRIISFVDVLKDRVPDMSVFRNGITFVGWANATGSADDYWTPVSVDGKKMAGVEIHANLAATLFSTGFVKDAPLTVNLLLIFGVAILVAAVAANFSALGALFMTVFVLIGYVFFNVYFLWFEGLQMSLANPFLAGMVPFMVTIAYRVAVEQRQARALQGALASVIPAQVAHEIARDPDRVKMGGERRVITVIFTDLKGFTTFSESVTPEVLSRVITEYLNAMVDVVFKHGGTVDKFIGDAVMAFWNAPLDVPDHARRACEAALEMQETLARLGDKWEAEGLPRHYMRIGINTGPVSVGNMGTSQRFSYTALGDTVNLGARLEPLNNEYGTSIAVSQATLDAAGGREKFLVRFLDLVAVKGKTEPVPVYELIGKADDQTLLEKYQPILEPYHRGMVLYQARQFDQAYDLFHRAMEATGNGPDAPSAVYVERCEELAKAPPEPEWDGVYVMHHK